MKSQSKRGTATSDYLRGDNHTRESFGNGKLISNFAVKRGGGTLVCRGSGNILFAEQTEWDAKKGETRKAQ